jgi:uncharacterized membrane protein YgcG
MRSQVTTGVAGFFQANHFGAISALLFSIILSACSGGYDNPESNDYASPSLVEVTVQDADAPLRDDVVLGGTFLINITSDEAIIAPTVMINGMAADSVSGSGVSWIASRMMTESDADGEITFNISFMDLNTNPGVDVSTTTDGSSIYYCADGCGNGGGSTDGTTDGATDGTTDGGTTDGGATDGGTNQRGSIEMVEGFGGALVDGNTFTFPTGAEVWGGFANLNEDVYPFTFANGGTITFTAAIPAGGSDTNVFFRFERLPHPDVDPSFNLDSVLISGEAEASYTLTIPAQDAANTYASFLMYVVDQDSPVMIKDIVVTDDTGSTGSTGSTGGTSDGGTSDGGTSDGGTTDGSTGAGDIEMIEGFGGALVDGNTYTFPAGSEVWAGFANLNEGVYPFTFANGGTITFTAAIPAGGSDTNIFFRFERLPHPDVDPSFNLDPVLISGETETSYTLTIPAQDAANTYASFLMYVVEQDSPVIVKDIVVTDDSGSTGGTGGGTTDGGATDGGSTDGGSTDGGSTDGTAEPAGDIEMIEGFGGALVDGDTFTFPAGAEAWAGFANLNFDVYPFTFANGGTITFTAAVPAGGSDTSIYFRFERLPFPDVDPSFNLDPVLISGEAELEYTITIPAQDAANTYESFLMYVVDQDSPVMIKNIVVTDDIGSTGGDRTTGGTGGGTTDGGASDGGATDGGSTDGDTPVSDVIDMTGSFGGAALQGDTYSFPAGSEVWAGFANLNTDVYPFSFANGGSITFTAAITAGGTDTNIYFRFERLPHPDIEPSFNLDPVLIVGETELEYTLTIPAQDAANTYESFLMYVVEQDSPVIVKDIVVTHDGGTTGLPEPEVEAPYADPTSLGIDVIKEASVTTEWGGNSSLSFKACGTCDAITLATVVDDQRGDVMQISYSAEAGHAVLEIQNTDMSVDVSAFSELSFDIKIINIGSDVGFNYLAKSSASLQMPVDIAVTDSSLWQTITVPVTSLSAVDLADVIAPFIIYPDIGKGAGLVYQLDDVRWQ